MPTARPSAWIMRLGQDVGRRATRPRARVSGLNSANAASDCVVEAHGPRGPCGHGRPRFGHVEDVVDETKQEFAARADVAAVIVYLSQPSAPKMPLSMTSAEAEDGVERRAQLVAHLGEELGFGAVGALGLRLLVEVALGEVGELLGLQLRASGATASGRRSSR